MHTPVGTTVGWFGVLLLLSVLESSELLRPLLQAQLLPRGALLMKLLRFREVDTAQSHLLVVAHKNSVEISFHSRVHTYRSLQDDIHISSPYE